MSRLTIHYKSKLRKQIKLCKEKANLAYKAGNTKLNHQYHMQMMHLQELLEELGK